MSYSPNFRGTVAKNLTAINMATGSAINLPVDGTGTINVHGGMITGLNALLMLGSISGSLTFNVPATVTPYSVTWPGAQSVGIQSLVNNGAGILSWSTVQFANQSLSNLTSPTAINQSLIPSGSENLGSSLNPWNNLFLSGSISGGTINSNSVTTNSLITSFVAGQSFSANTSYAVRWGLFSNGEIPGRIYAADIDTSLFDLFYVIGMAQSTSPVSPGGSINVTRFGSFTLGSSDTPLSTSSQGEPVFLTASGTFSSTPPSVAGQAVTRIGVLITTTTIDVDPVYVATN